MANGESSGAVETWRPGGISIIHLAFGFSVVAALIMAVLTIIA